MDDDAFNSMLSSGFDNYGHDDNFEDLFGEDEGFDPSEPSPPAMNDNNSFLAQDSLDGTNVMEEIPEANATIADDMMGDELGGLLAEANVEGGEKLDINNLQSVQDTVGKAADAIDFEDDESLASEEDVSQRDVSAQHKYDESFTEGPGQRARADDGDEDLFGEDVEDRYMDTPESTGDGFPNTPSPPPAAESALKSGVLAHLQQQDEAMDEEELRLFNLQRALFARGPAVEDDNDPEDMEDWLRTEFPDYNKAEEAPFWGRLLPPKPGKWQSKVPAKKPKPIRPTKVTLEIEQDHKALFTLPPELAQPVQSRPGLVFVQTKDANERLVTLSDEDEEDEDDLPNGITLQELEFICQDFDTLSHGYDEDPEPFPMIEEVDLASDDFSDYERPVKKRKLGLNAHEIATIHQVPLPSFDDPEKLTRRLAQKVILDLNDKNLLVEEIDPATLPLRAQVNNISKRTVQERLVGRFKTSNDHQYALLQQNQKKVRGQLTNMTIDHSLPAVKLQYPYYQVKLPIQHARNWHRRPLQFKQHIAFTKIHKAKRRDQRGRPVRDLYARTKDLSMGDNSTVVLLEYSEQHPTMLSHTGMGNKVVNYYRKTDSNDTSRPKHVIGETSVLMPEDKSPFNNFGHIDPGQNQLALYNTMYRAPLFKQTPENARHTGSNDFLVLRDTTGLNGSQHYLRNIDHMYLAGQQLPSVAVPGTHSRMVTTASKNRLKAISFRLARRKKTHRIRVEEVTRHFPDTNDMQNRQKMKEFMRFNKDAKEWEMAGNAPIPTEEDIREYNKPEDICLLESMQVGAQYLHDSGFAEDDKDDDQDKDDDGTANQSIEQKLVPWKTTKHFIQATQGKAMLELHGEGDPSGRGEAFSMIKISMKGGFRAQGVSANENVKGRGATGSHTYHVASQQKDYDAAIRSIWDRQKAVLSSRVEPEDLDDEGVDGQINNYSNNNSGTQTSVTGRRHNDETSTSFSRRSAGSQPARFLRIVRKIWNAREEAWEQIEVVESDPTVIKMYERHKLAEQANKRLQDLTPTGDPALDAINRQRLERQIASLEGAQAKRRKKNLAHLTSPSSNVNNIRDTDSPNPDAGLEPGDSDFVASTPAPRGRNAPATQRKCATCGMVGHIKTNKKLCPAWNGQISTDGTMGGTGGAGGVGFT